MQVQTPVFCADFSRFNEVSARSLPSLPLQTLVLIIFHVSLIKMLGRFVLTRALNHGGRSAPQQSCHEEYREGNYLRVTLASSLLLSYFFRTNTSDWGCLICLAAGSEDGGLGWYRRDVSRVWSREQHGAWNTTTSYRGSGWWRQDGRRIKRKGTRMYDCSLFVMFSSPNTFVYWQLFFSRFLPTFELFVVFRKFSGCGNSCPGLCVATGRKLSKQEKFSVNE